MQIAVVILAIVYVCIKIYTLEKANKARQKARINRKDNHEQQYLNKIKNNIRVRKDK